MVTTEFPFAIPAPNLVAASAEMLDRRISEFWSSIQSLDPEWVEQTLTLMRLGQPVPLYESVAASLSRVHKGIYLSLGKGPGTREIMLSANGNPDLFSLIFRIVSQVPPDVNQTYQVTALRQAQGFRSIMLLGDVRLDPKKIRCVPTQQGDRLNLLLFVPGFTSLDDPYGADIAGAVFVLLDHAIGEYDVATRLGKVDFYPLDEATSSAIPLCELVPPARNIRV